jgi:hypothetical protein
MKKAILILNILVLLAGGCKQQPTRTVTATIAPAILTQIAPTHASTDQPPRQSTLPIPTKTPQGFTITASRGNLTLHRGPGFQYDISGYFLKGQTLNIYGRNEDGSWLLVRLTTGKDAWISNMTSYTDIYGNVPGLPVIAIDPAVPAYIYNCTSHILTTQPGGYVIRPGVKEQVNPYDFYYVYDHDITLSDGSHPVVAKLTVTEGETATAFRDGHGNTYRCNLD